MADRTPGVLVLVDQSGSRWSSQEDFCLALTRALSAREARCVVSYSSQPAALVETVLRGAGAEIAVVPHGRAAPLAFARDVRRLCRRHQVDIAQLFHYVPSTRLTALLPLLAPCRVIVSDFTGGEGSARTGLKRTLFHAYNRLMNFGVARFVAPSRFVENRLRRSRGIRDRKITHIYNGIDLARFGHGDPAPVRKELGLSEHSRLILSVSNLLPLKAVDVLVRAFARLATDHPGAVLAIAGDGPERGRLEQLAAELGLRERTRFLGQRTDVPDLLSASSLFCCPSVWAEAFGWVNAEAMACGVPVVSTTTGAIPEVVEHGRCGLLVPPNDADAMGAAIRELLASPERLSAMGQAGRERAERLFDIRRTVDQYVALYERTAARARA